MSALAAWPVAAQSQTFWLANPVDSNYGNPADWSNGVPGAATAGIFTTSRIADIGIFGGNAIAGFAFPSGASAFTFRANGANARDRHPDAVAV